MSKGNWRDNTWLDSICTRGRNTVSARDCTDCVLHMTMCTGLYTCIHVHIWTSQLRCCTDLAITSREQLSDLRYFETNALFTLSTLNKLYSQHKKPVVDSITHAYSISASMILQAICAAEHLAR